MRSFSDAVPFIPLHSLKNLEKLLFLKKPSFYGRGQTSDIANINCVPLNCQFWKMLSARINYPPRSTS